MVGILSKRLKQPLIPAYIFAGVILGPGLSYLFQKTKFLSLLGITSSPSLIHNLSLIQTFSEIGIAFLLFIVGLEVDIKRLKDVEMVSSIGAILQMAVLFPLGFFVSQLLGFSQVESVYLGIILVFSSTMVVLKILSDKKELDTLHARIMIGILLIQDVLAIFSLLALSVAGDVSIFFFSLSIFKGVIVLVLAVLAGRAVFPWIFRFSAKSPELLFLTSLGVFFLYAFIFEVAGFSLAIGAFVAGITLGTLEYSIEIVGRIKPLRDFFATLFFVSLGMQLTFISLEKIILPLFVFFLFVIFAKPLIIMLTTAFFGYKKQTSFLTGISLGQISEFSLIIVAQGFILGHVSQDMVSLTILLAIVTLGITSYIMKYQQKMYFAIADDLTIFEYASPRGLEKEQLQPRPKKVEFLLCGYNRVGYSILQKLLKLKKKLLVIDFNPQIIKQLAQQKIACVYGDVSNPEVLEQIDLKLIKFVISSISNYETSRLLVDVIKRRNKRVSLFVTASTIDEALDLYEHGADYVILPHLLGGDHASLLLEDVGQDISKLIKTRVKHIEELSKRKALGHTK